MNNPREEILQTTSSLMEKQGYHGTGLNEIVRASGAPKGSLYHYFPDGKEQIASEAVLESGRITAERIRAELAASADPATAVHAFVLAIAHHVEASHFAAGGPLTAVAMETATQSERINAACREAYAGIEAAFREKLLASGRPQGQAVELAICITAAIEGGILLSRTFHSGDPLRAVATQLRALLSIE